MFFLLFFRAHPVDKVVSGTADSLLLQLELVDIFSDLIAVQIAAQRRFTQSYCDSPNAFEDSCQIGRI